MSKNLGAKPMLVPQPVMMIGTYDADGNANVMNAAWGGIVGANEIIFDLGSHKTTENIKLNKAFTVAIAVQSMWQPVTMWESCRQMTSQTR